MAAALGSLTPRQAWRMRLDEAVQLLVARAELLRRAHSAGPDQAREQRRGDGVTRHADGRMSVQVQSMEQLAALLGSPQK